MMDSLDYSHSEAGSAQTHTIIEQLRCAPILQLDPRGVYPHIVSDHVLYCQKNRKTGKTNRQQMQT